MHQNHELGMDSNSVSLPSTLSPPPSPSDGPSAVYGDIGTMEEQKPPQDFTRTWTPVGSLGYFTHDRYGLLSLVSLATNTEIRIEELGDNTNIQIRATAEWEIQKAMEKLDNLAVVMNLTDAPHHVSMVVASQSPSLRYQITDLIATRLAIQRVLLDTATPLGEVLAMQVLATYHYNTKNNSWNLLDQLCNPPALQTSANCSETIRTWKDFCFPGTGSSKVYSDFLPTVSSPQRSTKTDAGSEHHPYLEDFKAKEVGQWVNESHLSTSGTPVTISSSALLLASMDGAPKSELSSGEKTEEKMEPRKPRGIKKRITEAEYESRKADIAAQSVSSTPGTKSIISASPNRSETPSIYTPSVGIRPAEAIGSKLAFMSLPPFNNPEVPENVDKKLSIQFVPASKSTLRATAPIFMPQAILQKRIMELLDPAVEPPSMRKVPVVKLHGDLIDFDSPATTPAPTNAESLRLEPGTPSPEKVIPTPDPTLEVKNHRPEFFIDTSRGGTSDIPPEKRAPPNYPGDPWVEIRLSENLYQDSSSPEREDLLAGFRYLCKSKGCVAKVKARSTAPENQKCFPDLSLPNYPFISEDQSNCNEFETELPEVLHSMNQSTIEGKVREVEQPESSTRNRTVSQFAKSKECELEQSGPSTMHFTMNQKSGKNPLKKEHTEPKVVIEARRNALISKAWGGEQEGLSLPGPSNARPQENSKTTQMKNRQAAEEADQIRYLFRTIGPLLNAAASYPGTLNVDIQIGLLLLYRSPNFDKMERMTVKELKVLCDPNVELPPPVMKFFDRLTSSPADIDHIINLEVEDSRLFEAEPTDRNFEYEFHCNIGEERFLVVIDQSQMTTIPEPPVPIGSVYLNVPGNVWDASLTIYGSAGQFTKTSRDARQAAIEISQNIFVAPNRTHVRLVLKRSDGFKIAKVLLRRTTTHRHIRPNRPDKDSDIYLHVKETQDLIISINDSENVMAAHCAPLKEMVKASRQWWSVSLTSKILDTVLRRNLKLEPGDKATEWKPMSLFGDDAVHLSSKASRSSSPDLLLPLSESVTSSDTAIASSIGSAGLGALVSLAENVVKGIDFVGANNLSSSMNVDNTASATNPVNESNSQNGTASDSRALVLATKPFRGSVRW